jgi:hypothetical protein
MSVHAATQTQLDLAYRYTKNQVPRSPVVPWRRRNIYGITSTLGDYAADDRGHGRRPETSSREAIGDV